MQNLASIQKRTSPIKFAHLAEKSENGSISNLSTKVIATNANKSSDLAKGESGFKAVKTAAKIIVRYFVQIAIIGEFAVAWPSLNLFMFQWPDFLRFHRC